MEPAELTHTYLDRAYDASIARHFARYANELEYRSLPDDVIHQAKRSVLDTIGCAIGAYDAPGRESCEQLIQQLGGPPEATVFGSGLQTTAANATIVNSFLVRYLDCNDMGGGGHNSDAIPSLLAMAERENATGKEFVTSMVISYELGARVREAGGTRENWGARAGPEHSKHWINDFRGGLNMPPALGSLLGLSESQIANAIGCCTSRNLPLGILDAHREELTNTKNLRFGFVAYDAIISCLLAETGFTGPIRVVEGDAGVNEVLFDGNMDLDALIDFSDWRILETSYKAYCTGGTSLGHTLATLSIVRENDIKPEDVESVYLQVPEKEYYHAFNNVRKYPRNGETANHSGFYITAYVIKERDFGPDSHQQTNFSDPVILDLIGKTSADVNPDVPPYSRTGISEITTKDGERYRKKRTPPVSRGAFSDEEIEQKFENMVDGYLDKEAITSIEEAVWDLEHLNDVGELTQLITFE